MNNSDKKQVDLDDLISLQEASEHSGFSQAHLAHLIREGYMWGKKIGRNWVTTEQAVNEYLSHRNKPGPKPQNNQK